MPFRPPGLLGVLAVLAAGCGASGLPDQRVDGRWVRYHFWADEGPPCQAALDEIDRFVDQLAARLERPAAPLDYYKLRSVDELHRLAPCAVPHAGGCAVDGTVYAVTPTQDHEVVHAFTNRIGYPPQLFVEGLAVVFGCGRAHFSGAPLEQRDLAPLVDNAAWTRELSWATYLEAAALTRFLIDARGLPAFTAFYAATAHDAAGAALDARMSDAFGVPLSDALAQWRAGTPPREGEACLALDDVCEGSADLALGAAGASGQLSAPVSCVDPVGGLEVGAAPYVRLRFTSEQDGRAFTLRPCERSGTPARTFIYAYSTVSSPEALKGRFIDWWTPLLPGRYSVTVTRTPLPLTQTETVAPAGGTATVVGSAHASPWAATCSAEAVPVGDDTGILLVSGAAAALGGDAGVLRLAPAHDRAIDAVFTSGLAAPLSLCSACGPPPGCATLSNGPNPGARLSGPSSSWVLPEPDAGAFSTELDLGVP